MAMLARMAVYAAMEDHKDLWSLPPGEERRKAAAKELWREELNEEERHRSGVAESKQAAADAATEAWWSLVMAPIPRDVEHEITVLVARAPVMPPPNSLLNEERDYLVRLNRALALLYAAELRSEQLPPPIKNLMETLSSELYRRRISGV